MGASALAYEAQAEPQIGQPGPDKQGKARAQIGHGLGMKDLVPGFPENKPRSHYDEHALEPGGIVFDIAVPIRMAGIGRGFGHGHAHDGKHGGGHVDNGFQGVG